VVFEEAAPPVLTAVTPTTRDSSLYPVLAVSGSRPEVAWVAGAATVADASSLSERLLVDVEEVCLTVML